MNETNAQPQSPNNNLSGVPQQPTAPQGYPESPTPPKRGLHKGVIIAIVVSALVVVLGGIGLTIWLLMPKETSESASTQSDTSSSTTTQDSTANTAEAVTIRDSERITDISTLLVKMEFYFAIHGGYPTVKDLNDSTWRTANNIVVDDKVLADPLTPSKSSLSGSIPSSKTGSYAYITQPSGCTSMTNSSGSEVAGANACTSYEFVALLEDENSEYKDASSTSTQTFYKVSSTTE